MGKKVISTIYLDEETLEKAKNIGLNISKTCENALRQTIYRLEPTDLDKQRNKER